MGIINVITQVLPRGRNLEGLWSESNLGGDTNPYGVFHLPRYKISAHPSEWVLYLERHNTKKIRKVKVCKAKAQILMFCYDINPNKDWQKHFNFSIALRFDRFYVQSINRKLPPSSTSMRKSRRNARAHCSFEKRLLLLWERLLGFKRSPSSDVTDGEGCAPPLAG